MPDTKESHNCKLPNINDFRPDTLLVCADCSHSYRSIYYFDAEHGHWLVWEEQEKA